MGEALGDSDADRIVGALDGVLLKLHLEPFARAYAPRDHHDAARPLVEPVHDSRPHVLVADARLERVEVTAREQSMYERARLAARRRVHDDARRLHEHDEIVVDVEHLERHGRVGREIGRRTREGPHLDLRAFTHRILGPAHRAVDGHVAGFNPPNQLRTRRRVLALGEGADEKAVEPETRPAPVDEDYQSFDLMCPLALIRMSTRARS